VASAPRKPTLNAFARWHGIILVNVQAIPGEWSSPSGGHRGNHDPMTRGRREAALEPVRVVVELSPDQFQALERASGRLGPGSYVRAVALRLAEVPRARA
jgi:hypothetical protein